MQRYILHSMVGVLGIWVGLLGLVGPAGAAEPIDQVRSSLQELHRWLGTSDQAAAWRTYLKSDILLLELARGESADRDVVTQALNQYRSEAPGLNLEKFAAVRKALELWVEQLTAWQAEPLPDVLAKATEEFRPVTSDEALTARKHLMDALLKLENVMAKSSKTDRERWGAILELADLRKVLAAEDGPDLSALQSARNRFYQDEPGLERQEFLDVREGLRRYMNAIVFQDPKLKDDYASQLAELSTRLQALQNTGQRQEGAAVGRIVGWLDQARQARSLIRAIRRRFDQPNVYAQASAQLVAAGMADDVDRTSAVNESILGTAVRGQAHLRGRLSVSLIPNDRQAAVRLQLRGNAATDSVGFNRGVRIYTTGNTSVDATKMLYLDANGIHETPASALCDTQSMLRGVGAKCGLVEKIAWKKAQQSRPAAERIASRRAEGRVARQVDDQALDLIRDSNKRFRERVRGPLQRRDAVPELFHVRSTSENILVRILASNAQQVSTSDSPPAVPGNPDLALRLHETAVGNFSESMLGGRTVTDEEIRNYLIENEREVPDALSAEREAWSITFDTTQPVVADFRDGLIRIALVGRRFTRGDQRALRERAEISATYKLGKDADGKSVLQRQGDVVVDFVDEKSLSVAMLAYKNFLESKFGSLYKEQIALDGLELPGRWKKAGKLLLDHLNSDAGWLSVAWLQPSGGNRAVDTRTAARD